MASPERVLQVLQAPAQLSHTTNTFEEHSKSYNYILFFLYLFNRWHNRCIGAKAFLLVFPIGEQ